MAYRTISSLNIIFGNRGNEEDRASNIKYWSCHGLFDSVVKVAFVVATISLGFTCYGVIWAVSMMVNQSPTEPNGKKVFLYIVLVVEFLRIIALIYWIKNSKEGYTKSSSATKICMIFTTIALVVVFVPTSAIIKSIFLDFSIISILPFLLDIIFSICYGYCVAQHFLYDTSRAEAQVRLNDWAHRDNEKYRRTEPAPNLDSESEP